MTATGLLLQQSLDEAYAALLLGQGSLVTVIDRFKKNLDQVNGLRDAAISRLNELKTMDAHCMGDLAKRCTVSAVQLDFLKGALKL